MNKSQKIKIGIFTGIILISSIILIFLAVNAYSYPDARMAGKVSISLDDTNKKVLINNPNNLSLSYIIEDNTSNMSDDSIEQLKQDTTSIEQLTSQINTLNGEISSLTNEITPLETQLNTYNNEKSGLESQKAEWESQKASYTAQANSLRSEITTWGTSVSNLESRVAYLQANASASTEGELYAATHELDEARQKLGELRSDLTDAESNIDMLTQNISNVSDEISYYTTQIRTLNSQIAGKTATLTAKQNQVSEKQAQISTIQRQMPSLPTQPTSGYTNLSSNEISFDEFNKSNNNLLWIKSTSGNDTYYDYFLVTIPDISVPDIPTPPTYTITFDPNGGTVQTTTKEVMQGEKYGALPTAQKTGYTFNGWFTEKNNGSEVTSDTVVNLNTNQTLYAHYTENKTNINDDWEWSGGLIVKDITAKLTNEEKANYKKLFPNVDHIYVFDASQYSLTDSEKGKELLWYINSITLPDDYQNYNIKVYSYDGTNIKELEYKINDNNIYFKSSTHDKFVLTLSKKTNANNNDNSNNNDNQKNNNNNDNSNNNDNNEDENIGNVKEVELTDKEKDQYEKEFPDVDAISVYETNIDEKYKNDEFVYEVTLKDEYKEGYTITVYAYVDGEKIIIPSKVENGVVKFETSLKGRFVITAKKISKTTTTNQSIINPQTGDINIKVIVTLLVIAIIASGISLFYIFKNNKKN